MIFQSLASSSHGNAYIVSDQETRILLECGISRKKLQKFSGFQLHDLTAVLVSHEHKDHAGYVADLIRDGMIAYMSEGTGAALLDSGALSEAELDTAARIAAGEQFSIGTLDIVPFATFHDAREPLGFLIKSRLDSEALVFATDTVNLRYRFPDVTILAIEANYDKEILDRCERLPDKVRHRITNCHMEIGTLCRYLQELDLSGCREIHLLHLSDATSHEGHFINKVCRVVPPWVRVDACRKEGNYGGETVLQPKNN